MKNIFLYTILLGLYITLAGCHCKSQSKVIEDAADTVSASGVLNVENVDEALDQFEATAAEVLELGEKTVLNKDSVANEYHDLKSIYDAYKMQLGEASQDGTWMQTQIRRYNKVVAETTQMLGQL